MTPKNVYKKNEWDDTMTQKKDEVIYIIDQLK